MHCDNCGEEHCDEYINVSSNHNWSWILFILLILSLFFRQKKYEGMTAEEWADEYYDANWCIENAIDYVEDSPDAYYYLSQCY